MANSVADTARIMLALIEFPRGNFFNQALHIRLIKNREMPRPAIALGMLIGLYFQTQESFTQAVESANPKGLRVGLIDARSHPLLFAGREI